MLNHSTIIASAIISAVIVLFPILYYKITTSRKFNIFMNCFNVVKGLVEYILHRKTLKIIVNNMEFIHTHDVLKSGDIPSFVTHLMLGSDSQINPGDIPNSVTHLEFNYGFDKQIPRGFIPNSVIYLDFGTHFNQPLEPGIIPNSVTHLKFGWEFNQPLTIGTIPNSVTHLVFGHNFNQPLIPGIIPNSITHLVFGFDFNKRLIFPEIIPNSVTHLVFGHNFNKSLVPGVIPNSVTHLKFGSLFDKILVPGDIPNSVTHLVFGDYFNKPLNMNNTPILNLYTDNKGIIPNSVTHLVFGEFFNQKLVHGDIPQSVTHLEFGWCFDTLDTRVIPDSINYMRFSGRKIIYQVLESPFSDSTFLKLDRYRSKIYNKWTRHTCKYFEKEIYIRIFESRTNSGILDNIPYELLCYILEYDIHIEKNDSSTFNYNMVA